MSCVTAGTTVRMARIRPVRVLGVAGALLAAFALARKVSELVAAAPIDPGNVANVSVRVYNDSITTGP